jgi:Holliday junction resolvase
MTNYARGAYLEHQTKQALESYGWVVQRSAGSHGGADLWACRAGKKTLFVQCKILGPGRDMPRVDPRERAELWEAAEKAGARAIIATRYRDGWVTLLELHGPAWTQYPYVDELHVPGKAAKP